MYKLREERLKDLYSSSDVKDVHMITNKKSSFNQSMHADALTDHSFASLKRKEIRDSESPTKDVSYRMKGKHDFLRYVKSEKFVYVGCNRLCVNLII